MKSATEDALGDPVVIQISDTTNLPPGTRITLVDRTLERRIDLLGGSGHTMYLRQRESVSTAEEARFRLVVGSESFVEDESNRLVDLPERPALYQNDPNPFNPFTVIQYDVAAPGMVTVDIYNLQGARVKSFEAVHRDRGRYQVRWSGEDDHGARVSSGIYLYKLTASGFSQTRKMVLVR
jgi:hypothetical protein